MFLEQFTKENSQQGWIEVICGSMFSGKTEELIRRLRRAEFAKQTILLFKPRRILLLFQVRSLSSLLHVDLSDFKS